MIEKGELVVLLTIILNKVDCLEELLTAFADNDISGATILESTGMAHTLGEMDENKFIGSLRMVLDLDRKDSKTIFMVIPEDQIKKISSIVNRVTGGLDKPDTGILFTLPVSYTEGIRQ